MSTNYYHRFNECEHCGRYDEKHIGKNSGGWQFSFRAYVDGDGNVIVGSWADWQNVLKAGRIFDEYGKEVSLDWFVALVEESRGKQNHYDYVKNAPQYQEAGMNYLRDDYKDSDGWDFSRGAFS